MENSENTPKPSEQKPNVLVVFTQDGCGKCPDFLEKAKVNAPKDVEVVEFNLGKDRRIDLLADIMKVRETPTAFYLEGGDLKKRIIPTGVAEKDRQAISQVKTPAASNENQVVAGGTGTCEAKISLKKERWELKLNSGPECESVISDMKSLGPASRTHLAKHIVTDDPKIRLVLKALKKDSLEKKTN